MSCSIELREKGEDKVVVAVVVDVDIVEATPPPPPDKDAVDVVAVVREENGLGPSPGCGVTASTS